MNKKTCLDVFLKLEVLKNFHDNSNNVLNYVVSGNLLNGKKLKVITRLDQFQYSISTDELRNCMLQIEFFFILDQDELVCQSRNIYFTDKRARRVKKEQSQTFQKIKRIQIMKTLFKALSRSF